MPSYPPGLAAAVANSVIPRSCDSSAAAGTQVRPAWITSRPRYAVVQPRFSIVLCPAVIRFAYGLRTFRTR